MLERRIEVLIVPAEVAVVRDEPPVPYAFPVPDVVVQQDASRSSRSPGLLAFAAAALVLAVVVTGVLIADGLDWYIELPRAVYTSLNPLYAWFWLFAFMGFADVHLAFTNRFLKQTFFSIFF